MRAHLVRDQSPVIRIVCPGLLNGRMTRGQGRAGQSAIRYRGRRARDRWWSRPSLLPLPRRRISTLPRIARARHRRRRRHRRPPLPFSLLTRDSRARARAQRIPD